MYKGLTMEIVKCLLAAGADKDKFDNGGWTPMTKAAYWGHVELSNFCYLLELTRRTLAMVAGLP